MGYFLELYITCIQNDTYSKFKCSLEKALLVGPDIK